MARFEEEERKLLYVVRSTVEQGRGNWADCERIYNHLSQRRRGQDSLSRAYRGMNKEEMERDTRARLWFYTRQHVTRLMGNATQAPMQGVYGLDEGQQVASPVPVQTLSNQVELWEQAAQAGPDDGSSQWLGEYAPTERSIDRASSPYTTTAMTTAAATTYCDCNPTRVHTIAPVDCTVSAHAGPPRECNDTTSNLLSHGPSTEAVMNAHSSSGPRSPTQQTSVYEAGTAGCFDQRFAQAHQQTTSTFVSAPPAAVAPLANQAGTRANIDTSDNVEHGRYLGTLEHGHTEGPTAGIMQGADWGQPTYDTTREMSYQQSLHFSAFPNLSAEAMGHVNMLAWDNSQITMSLEGLESLLTEEESDCS